MDETALTIRENEVADYSGVAERVHPISEASVVQTAPGPEPTDLTLYSSKKITVIGLRHHSPSVGVVIIRPEHFGLMWWQGQKDVRINGELARSTKLYTQGEQDGFHVSGGERTTMGIAVRRDDLIETLAALRGVTPEDILLKHAVLQLSPEATNRFRSGINLYIQNAMEPGKDWTAGAELEDPGESIFGQLVDAFLHSAPERLREDKPYPPEKIVRKAEERFYAAEEAPISLADLCLAAGVSQSTLYRAFYQVCDQPPLAYFRKRRLSSARRKLVNSSAVRGAVKHIALSTGLTELGRFSVEYRRLYGESPSTTLNRNLHL